MRKNYKGISEILTDSGLVDKDKVDAALAYQMEFGGNAVQYLIDRNHINEEDIAKYISIEFDRPYLPLRAYEISTQVISLVPSEIAERYWLIPVDKIENIITVVMVNPLDSEAIEAVEKATGCEVQPFVGVLSDIAKAIEHYYDVTLEDKALTEAEKEAPLFVKTPSYTGPDRRRAVRIKCRIAIHFVDPNIYHRTNYIKAETKNVSRVEFLFESANILPMNSFLNLGIHLPEKISQYPIHAVVQVARVRQLAGGKFDVGVKIVSIKKTDISKIIKYGEGVDE